MFVPNMWIAASGCNGGHPAGEVPAAASVIVLTQPAAAGPMERPPVAFDHAKHTNALGTGSCAPCHAVDAQQVFLPEIAAVARETDAAARMTGFHELCIDCHREKARGPATCAECHVEQPTPAPVRVEPPFDYSLHERHVRAEGRESCGTCHHEKDATTGQLVYRKGNESGCSDCHGEEDAPGMRSHRWAAHRDCIGCHTIRGRAGRKAGPIACLGCHATEGVQAIARLDDAAPMKRGQPERAWLGSGGGGGPMVPFDHALHERTTSSCSTCHHQTMRACRDCHTAPAKPEGGGVTLEAAYHAASSERSCVGCHQQETEKPACAGCHQAIREGESQRACGLCHSGPKRPDDPSTVVPFPAPTTLAAPPAVGPDFPEQVVIGGLADRFAPATVPHRRIATALDKVARESRLATHFHGRTEAVCAGCHHNAPMAARPAPCRSCHGETSHASQDRPALKGALHRQCMGCHQAMGARQQGVRKQGCTDCHAKAVRAALPDTRRGRP